MTTIQNHKKKISEHLEELHDAIRIGAYQRPATIGFHATACAIDLLEVYLHKKELIDIGKVIKHEWFKRPKEGQKIDPLIERKLPVHFQEKGEIYHLFYILESNRDVLIYGSPKKEQVDLVLETFRKLKKILVKKIEGEGETLE